MVIWEKLFYQWGALDCGIGTGSLAMLGLRGLPWALSDRFRLCPALSWLETRLTPHFKHFILSVGLIWPQESQCHCSTDAMEPIAPHSWLLWHNNHANHVNNSQKQNNENSWSTMFVYYFFWLSLMWLGIILALPKSF